MKYINLFLTTLLLISAVVPSGTVTAQAFEEYRSITVSGEGIVDAIPDMATVRFGISTKNWNPEKARAKNAEVSKNALNVVRDLGIEERKIRLATLRLQPIREYNPQTRKPEDKGFEATRELVVEIEDLEMLPALIAGIVQEGANRLNGISYGLQDRENVRDKALVMAMTRAKSKATLMAASLDAELGGVWKITEQSFSMPRPVVHMADHNVRLAKAEAAPEPEAYAAGEMEVRAVVQVTFLIK
ncbi:MAG: SIMPL domain-containing protein [Bacteroidota bacterium]